MSCRQVTAVALVLGLCAPIVRAQSNESGEILRTGKMVQRLLAARAHHLGVSAGPDPDTVYIGKSFSNHVAPDNYWNLYVGTYRPGTAAANNSVWDWDNTVGIQAADSLQGWWPLRRQYNLTGGVVLTDDQRPWWAIDHGNLANYVISQQSSAKRTFGVVGIWHADPGRNAGVAVPWTPLSGTKSAWCGLRQHGDQSVIDLQTKNAFNQDTEQFLHDPTSIIGGSGSPQSFPGYPDQIDQMLYRDIAMTPSQSLSVSFKYRTRMSTSIVTAPAIRTGWFHGDPLAVTAGNFISSSAAGASAPQDSFMVYVGAPVNDAACVYSDGVTRAVYDPQRRWFSEVLKVFGAGNNYFEIFSATGNNPADTLGATPTAGPIVVPSAQISTILGGAAGNVRLVFRCKTNRGFADSDTRFFGYSSNGYGAVQVDDVTIDTGSGPAVIGDFEGAEQGGVNAIDNRFPLPPGLLPTDVWRSTGKPPAEYFHVENLAGLTYNDLCGPPNSPTRICNIGGLVVTVGNHDDGERVADSRFAAFHEVSHFIASPVINLVGGAGGAANSMGISSTIANATDDYVLWYDLYAGIFNFSFTGDAWRFGHQCYPAMMPNGGKCWGQLTASTLIFNPEPQCFTDLEGFRIDGIPFRTSNPSGIPDSVRICLTHEQVCFRFGVTLGCNSSDGAYFDNVALAFIDRPGQPGQASADNTVTLGNVTSDLWQFVNDTFPANETAGLPGTAAFDTAGALIRTGLNTAASVVPGALRFDLPGDSSVVSAFNASVTPPDDPALANVRVDLVFRVLPGPGNYQIAAGRNMVPGGTPIGTLLQVPQNQSGVVTPGDASFWGQYIADAGEVSAGDHHGHTSWDPLTWNSARMDTSELDIFPTQLVSSGLGAPFGGGWMTCYHELDPKFTTLGVSRFKCFVIDTTLTATSSPSLQNVNCTGVVPAWLTTVPRSRTGWDGSATTREFTKIIPDGLLTPGAHVQYFYRKSHAANPLLEYAMCPDTNFITPQSREGSTDAHRWQQFGVLPDRWKNSAYGGAGSACMLYVDWDDRRGNEAVFVSVMDSIGGTAVTKHGAHNGWSAPGNVNINSLDVRTNMSVAVSNKNSQPGTVWDMYGVKAAEDFTTSSGSLGNRLANRTGLGFAAGREAKLGPTPEMLRAYYRIVAILTGDLSSGIFGPFVNRSQNDIALLNDFVTQSGGTAQPRGLFIQGDGFGQSEKASGGIDPSHTQFLTDKLGVVFRNVSYQSISGNTSDCADLLTTTSLTPSNGVYGVANTCTWSNDVYQRNPAIPESSEGAFYENVGLGGPYVADVVKPATAPRNWVALTSGYDVEHLFERYCSANFTCTGRQNYYFNALNKVFGGICQLTGSNGCLVDVPGGSAREYVNFMKIGNAVQRSRASLVHLGIAAIGRVQVNVYDVAGRRVRTLADRIVQAGELTLAWDGTDDTGAAVARGVYFVRSSTDPRPGRIIVLK